MAQLFGVPVAAEHAVSSLEKVSKVDYRMLGMLSNLVICTRCLRQGRITPVPQLLSARHKPRALCHSCTPASPAAVRRGLARVARIW